MPRPKNPFPKVERITSGRFVRNDFRGVARFQEADAEEITSLRASGLAIPRVREITGWPDSTVRTVCRAHGMPAPPRTKVAPAKDEHAPRGAAPPKTSVLGVCRFHLGPRMTDYRDGCMWLDGSPAPIRKVMLAAYEASVRMGAPIDLADRAWRDIE